jgi:hypothetical protein
VQRKVVWVQDKVRALGRPRDIRRRVKEQRIYLCLGSEFTGKEETEVGLSIIGISRSIE